MLIFPPDPGLVNRIFPVLAGYLVARKSGRDFAAWLIEHEGRDAYFAVHDLGENRLLELVQSSPQASAFIRPMHGRFMIFLREFLACGVGA